MNSGHTTIRSVVTTLLSASLLSVDNQFASRLGVCFVVVLCFVLWFCSGFLFCFPRYYKWPHDNYFTSLLGFGCHGTGSGRGVAKSEETRLNCCEHCQVASRGDPAITLLRKNLQCQNQRGIIPQGKPFSYFILLLGKTCKIAFVSSQGCPSHSSRATCGPGWL